MKTTQQWLSASALILLVGCGVFTAFRRSELETHPEECDVHQTGGQSLTYAFDEAFIRYFGEEGMAAVARAVSHGVTDPDEILRQLRRDHTLRLDI